MTAYRYPRRYRRRYRGTWGASRVPPGAIAAGLALAALAGGTGAAVTHHHRHAVKPAVIPDASSYTPQSWARAFLAAIPEPETACNLAAIEAWESAEGGAWGNSASANPLNTARPEPGSYAINSDGVQAYPSWQEGLQGNVAAITNGLYGPVLSALSAGNDAQAVADAVASSPWGTGPFQASC